MNCAGLGEAWLGAGRRFRNLILLTLGTVGGAIILDGKLFVGHQGSWGTRFNYVKPGWSCM